MVLKLSQLILTCSLLIITFTVFSQENQAPQVSESSVVEIQGPVEDDGNDNEIQVEEEEDDEDTSARDAEAELNEDPEAQRRSKIAEEPELELTWPTIHFYGSLIIHANEYFDVI
jgi:hypothetical protein